MEIQFYGANCIRLTTKKATVIIDDLKGEHTKAGDIVLFTGTHDTPKVDTAILIDEPGEYEISDVSIQGVAARSHMDEKDSKATTMYKIVAGDVRAVVTGHIYPELNEAQLESLGIIDVLLIPVGGNGYTLDGIGALTITKEIEPKVVIPTHYADKGITYEVPQQTLEEAIKGLAMEPKETVQKLKLKGGELLNEAAQLVILEKS